MKVDRGMSRGKGMKWVGGRVRKRCHVGLSKQHEPINRGFWILHDPNSDFGHKSLIALFQDSPSLSCFHPLAMAAMAKLSMDMLTARTLVPTTPSPTSPPSLPRRPSLSISLPTSTTISLLALFPLPSHAKALSISKDQIVSSLTQVEQTLDQVQEAGSGFFDTTQRLLQALSDALKPALDTALPVVRQAAEEALEVASPAISEASKKAQQALQSSGLDTQPVLTAAKVSFSPPSSIYLHSPQFSIHGICAPKKMGFRFEQSSFLWR